MLIAELVIAISQMNFFSFYEVC